MTCAHPIQMRCCVAVISALMPNCPRTPARMTVVSELVRILFCCEPLGHFASLQNQVTLTKVALSCSSWSVLLRATHYEHPFVFGEANKLELSFETSSIGQVGRAVIFRTP